MSNIQVVGLGALNMDYIKESDAWSEKKPVSWGEIITYQFIYQRKAD